MSDNSGSSGIAFTVVVNVVEKMGGEREMSERQIEKRDRERERETDRQTETK